MRNMEVRPSQEVWWGSLVLKGLGGIPVRPRVPRPCKPAARQQRRLTAIQQLVLHTVALQRLLTLRLLPAHFQGRGPQG